MAITAAMQAMQKARARLIMKHRFFGALSMRMELIEWDPKNVPPGLPPTMATDGYNIYFCDGFVSGLTDDELMGVVAHEILHCVYKHTTRRNGRHPELWNIACDYRINADLLECGIVLPKDRLHDPKWGASSSEEIYSKMLAEMKEQPKGNGPGDGNGCGVVLDAGQGPKKDDDNNEDKGGSQVESNDKLERDWELAVVQAANEAVREARAGQLPGFIQRLIDRLQEPKVDWKELTRQWIDGHMNKEYAWARPNRRMFSHGLILPGYVSDSINHLIMVIDVSGSISNKMMAEMVSEGAGALEQRMCDQLTIIYADDGVRHVDEFLPGDFVEARTMGGGGTCFNASFKWIKENAPDATCIAYLTDMETCGWGEDLGIPTLWAAYNSKARLQSIQPPFGTVIHASDISY